jgi:protein TonB
MAEYPGGDGAMMKFIKQNLVYPKMERDSGIQRCVVVGFIVHEDGSLSDITIKRGVSKGLDEEAIRVIKLSPKFKPAMQRRKPVKVDYVIPIMFKL